MPASPNPAFAEAFERLRKGRGWTPAEVARQLDVYPTEVSRWRRGLGISIKNVRKIADLFEVDRAWLEELAGYPESGPKRDLDGDLKALLSTMGVAVQGVPRRLWPTFLAASTALADALSSSAPVSDPATTPVSESDATGNRGESASGPRLANPYHGRRSFAVELVTGVRPVSLAVTA